VNARSTNARRFSPLTAAMVTGVLVFASASPSRAAHRARLSADLADHLAAGSTSIPVIVHGSAAEVAALAARYNLVIKRRMKSGAVLQVNAGQLDALAQDDAVDHLSGDVPIRASDVTTESIGADQVWAGTGDLPKITGAGVTVAVIDSGINMKVEANALKKRVIGSVDFTGGDGLDHYGHGTHVAGIIAGQQGRTADTRQYSGVAPGAYLLNLRVLGDDGSGNASDVIEAIDWAIDHRAAFNIGVINLSLGAPVLQPYRDDPLCEAVERAVRAGIAVVAAAGNFGRLADGTPVRGGIVSPGNSPWAITVGALDTHGTPERSDDTVASYSSRGPTRYDLVLKPDLVAPGSHIVSTEAVGSMLSTNYADHHVTGNGPNAYMQLSGTSMAAGVVSGAVALILEQRPRLTPSESRTTLQLSSSFVATSGILGGGAGSLNVFAALKLVDGKSRSIVDIVSALVERIPAPILVITRSSRTSDHVETVVWGNAVSSKFTPMSGKTVIWGNSDTVIWGSAETVVWGNSDTVIWGSSDTVIWGSLDTVVWGNADTVIWGNSDTVIWGNSDTVIWGNTAAF